MPPVLGPVSPSPARLKSWAATRTRARTPSQIAMTESSGPVRPSSMTTRRPAPPKVAPESLARASAIASSRSAVTSTPLPAASPSVLTTHGPGSDRRNSRGRTDLVKDAVAGGRHTGVRQHVLHPGFGALQPGPVGARPEDQSAGGSQPIGQATYERLLGPDHEQVGVHDPRAIRARRPHPGRPCRRCPGRRRRLRCGPSAKARACSRPPVPVTHTRRRLPARTSEAATTA